MDLFAIAGAMWRYKIATLPIVLLTLLGLFYILEIEPPTYEAKASVLLTNPPNPPSASQIAADPKLARVNTNNPLASLGNLDLVADVVIEVVSSPASKQSLVQVGVNPNYQLTLDSAYGSPPAINITGVGSNAPEAIQSAQLLADAVSQGLLKLQQNQHINSGYMIDSIEYVKPTTASVSSSGKLRTLIAVFGVGIILLLVAVSIAQMLEIRRKNRSRSGIKSARRRTKNRRLVADSSDHLRADAGIDTTWSSNVPTTDGSYGYQHSPPARRDSASDPMPWT